MTLDIATKSTGYSIYWDGTFLISGTINADIKEVNKSWIPEGEGRSKTTKNVRSKTTGEMKVKSLPDNKLREDCLHNRIVYQHKEIKRLIEEYKIDYIVKEETICCLDAKVSNELGKAHGIIMVLDIPIISYYPTEWQSTIKKELKRKNLPFTIDLYDYKGYNDKIIQKLIKKYSNKQNLHKSLSAIYFNEMNDRLPLTLDEADSFCIGQHHLQDESIFGYKQLIYNEVIINYGKN
jgi:hypothetical protein